VNGRTYASTDEARNDIGAFIENVYSRGRLHSALDYKPPLEFKAELRQLETL
jgi:putative transposase